MRFLWLLGRRVMRLLLLQEDLIDVLGLVPIPLVFFTFLGRYLESLLFEISPLRLCLTGD